MREIKFYILRDAIVRSVHLDLLKNSYIPDMPEVFPFKVILIYSPYVPSSQFMSSERVEHE